MKISHAIRCKEWRDKNPEKSKESSRSWRKNNLEKNREIQNNYKKNNREKINSIQREYSKNNPEKMKAHSMISNHKIPLKDKCKSCGTSERLEHHHPDYSKPLLTITLCKKCHTNIHKGE